VKAGLFDARPQSVGDIEVTVAHEQRVASDGTSEEDVGDIAAAVERAVDEVLAKAGALASEIAAVGMDSMASTILAVDADARPLTPVYLYSDTRTAQDVEALKRELDVDAVHDRTGTMQHTSYVPGRVRWLRRTQPETAAKVARWLDASTYLFTRWFGRRDVTASYSVSAWSGMLNRRDLAWDADLLRALELTEDNLPKLGAFDTRHTGLCDEFARRWPALKDVPFFPAVGDGAAVNIGAGCVSEERVALTVGTTSAMRLLRWGESPAIPSGLWGYRLGANGTLVGGAFSEGGALVEWAQSALKLPPLKELDAALLKQRPDAHGLTVLPFLAGERATGWSTKATGVFVGLRVSTTPLDMAQAMMEAVSLRFAQVAELLLPERKPGLKLIATGGAVRSSRWWLQAMADALALPVVVNEEEQETSRGAAALALFSLGVHKTLSSVAPRVRETFQPRPEVTAVFRDAIARQRDLYTRILG
jgi:gluconokinase